MFSVAGVGMGTLFRKRLTLPRQANVYPVYHSEPFSQCSFMLENTLTKPNPRAGLPGRGQKETQRTIRVY
jgi:hypothetical protein